MYFVIKKIKTGVGREESHLWHLLLVMFLSCALSCSRSVGGYGVEGSSPFC